MRNSLQSVLSLIICVMTLCIYLPQVEAATDGKNSLVAAEAYIDDHQLTTALALDDVLAYGFVTATGSMDLSSLDGMHTLYIRMQDDAGLWSHPIGQIINVSINGQRPGKGHHNTLTQAEYFYDEDPGAGNGTLINVPEDGVFDQSIERLMTGVPLQGLSPGKHTFYLRFKDANNNWSVALGQSLYIDNTGFEEGNRAGNAFGFMAAEAYFDTDPGAGAGLPMLNVETGVVATNAEAVRALVDVAQLTEGIHTLYIRYLNQSGVWSKSIGQSLYIGEQFVNNTITNGTATIQKADYSLDSGAFQPAPLADGVAGGLVEEVDFQVAVSLAGYHSAEVRFTDSKGRTSRRFKPTNYTPQDLDWDGLPDAWEMARFGHLNYSGLDDPDSDGLTNAQEFYNGTDPLVRDNPDTPALNSITISNVFMQEGGNQGKAFTFNADLTAPLPEGYGVFLNFDDLRGNWFVQNTPGGHVQLTDNTGSRYSLNRDLDKLGLRTFRAAIFNLATDQRVGEWSQNYTCTLDLCLSTVVRHDDFGNPSLHGSQLFKQVDVASGNYHFATSDLSVTGKGPSFSMTRAYNSMGTTRDGSPAPWSFGYEMKASFEGIDTAKELVIGPREDGRLQYYFKDFVDGNWTALNPGNFDQIIENIDGSFTLYTQGNRLYHFADPEGAEVGRLQNITNRLGHALSFNYNASNDLIGATDANDRPYTIERNSENRIFRVTDFATRYVEYTYDSNGMINTVRNMRGGNHQYSYTGTTGDNRYRLATIIDPRDKLQLSIVYNTDGRVDTLVNGIGNETSFRYGTAYTNGPSATGIVQPIVDDQNHNRVYVLDDNRSRVVEMVDAKAYGEDFTTTDISTKQEYAVATQRTRIAENALVTRIVDPKAESTTISYTQDGKGKPQAITDAESNVRQMEYAPETTEQINLSPVSVSKLVAAAPDLGDIVTQYQDFTATGQASKIIDPLGYISQRAYDLDSGLLTDATNPRDFTTQYSYDAEGNVTGITDALNNVTIRDYDELGRISSEISPLGLTTSYTYDENGNVLSQIEQAAGIDYTTRYGYDASDNLSWTIDPKNHRTDYVYDDLNRKIEEHYTVNNVAHTRSYAYDAMGRLRSVTNERNQTSTTHYDSRSQVKSRINALNETTVSYEYDVNGNVVTTTDGESRKTTTEYDKLNRKTKVTDDQGNYQQWTYNKAGQVATHRDTRGKITQYEYDANGNLTRLIDPVNGVTTSTYDGNGNVLTVTDPNQHTTTYTYDALDRRLTTTLHDGQQWRYSYDVNGNLIREITPESEQTVQLYDALNRVKQLTELAANGNIERQISYDYDANGNVTSESSAGNTISYSYDELNRITSVTDTYGKTIGYAYDMAGNRTGLTYPGNKTISYVYDNADRLQSLTDWLNNATIYTRNAAGQITDVENGNGTKTHYGYDTVGRLILLNNLKADNSVISSHDLTLDEAGNITQATMDLPLTPVMPATIANMSYDNNNRLLDSDSNSYSHDLSGRIIQQDKNGIQTVYSFDINDHISSVTHAGNIVSQYAYDLNDNRISQTQNGTETRYVIDPLASLPNVVAETDALGNVSHYYLYGDGLVSQIDTAGNSHYYHYDPTGHTLALSDANGNVSDKYAYAPYGLTTWEGLTHNPFRFVGKHGVMDDDNGLHYMRARYYKEDIKRFMSLDALHGDMMTPQALNRYAYVLGNPVMGVDPSGNNVEDSKTKIRERAKSAIKTIHKSNASKEIKSKLIRKVIIARNKRLKQVDSNVELKASVETNLLLGVKINESGNFYDIKAGADAGIDLCENINFESTSGFLEAGVKVCISPSPINFSKNATIPKYGKGVGSGGGISASVLSASYYYRVDVSGVAFTLFPLANPFSSPDAYKKANEAAINGASKSASRAISKQCKLQTASYNRVGDITSWLLMKMYCL